MVVEAIKGQKKQVIVMAAIIAVLMVLILARTVAGFFKSEQTPAAAVPVAAGPDLSLIHI